MSKVVLFSTRAIGENTLFGTDCERRILNQDNPPIFKYFTGGGASDDEKKELVKLFPPETLLNKIKTYCSQKDIWQDDYENLSEEDVLCALSNIEQVKNDAQFKDILGMYYSPDSQTATDFNIVLLKNYLTNANGCIRFALNIDNPETDVAIDERFTIYKKVDKQHQEYVFIAIWPLAWTEKNEENGQNKWISTLVEQIRKLVQNCDEIILCLHDKDVADKQPFKVIIPKSKYKNENLDLTVSIFQHTPGDPINTILNTPETDLYKVYNNISAILSKRADMVIAGNTHTTRQVYQQMMNNLKKAN